MEKRKFSVLKQMDNKTMLNKISGFSFIKTMVCSRLYNFGICYRFVHRVHSLWKNTFGQINIVRETDAEKKASVCS